MSTLSHLLQTQDVHNKPLAADTRCPNWATCETQNVHTEPLATVTTCPQWATCYRYKMSTVSHLLQIQDVHRHWSQVVTYHVQPNSQQLELFLKQRHCSNAVSGSHPVRGTDLHKILRVFPCHSTLTTGQCFRKFLSLLLLFRIHCHSIIRSFTVWGVDNLTN